MADWLTERLPEMEGALSALVNVNSFTDNREGGNRVVDLLRGIFTVEGLSAEVVPSERTRSESCESFAARVLATAADELSSRPTSPWAVPRNARLKIAVSSTSG